MKKLVAVIFGLSLFMSAFSVSAAGKIPKDLRDDAEYMMRKIVEDIHTNKVRTTVTDVTLDKSIKVVGYALKFTPSRADKQIGEMVSCALVSLKANLQSGKKNKAQITRKDEICTGKITGRVKYVANVR